MQTCGTNLLSHESVHMTQLVRTNAELSVHEFVRLHTNVLRGRKLEVLCFPPFMLNI